MTSHVDLTQTPGGPCPKTTPVKPKQPQELPFYHPFGQGWIDPDSGQEVEEDEEAANGAPAEDSEEREQVADGAPAGGGSAEDEPAAVQMTVSASGGDSSDHGAVDTLQLPPPRCGLRVMSWNLQDLGGGPSRGPKRTDRVIQRIARILVECDPDICVILEVKRRVYLPPKPIEPAPPPRTRARKTVEALSAEYQKRVEDFKVKSATWEKLREEAQKTDPKAAPGIVELERILAAMNHFAGRPRYARLDSEQRLPPEAVFTEGETYGFIVNTDVVASGKFELMSRDKEGAPLLWPEAGYRAPARASFGLHNWPRPVDVVAFHAPAPSHGEITHQAIEQFSKVKWESDTIVAGDFNVDTEVGDAEASEKALDTLLSFFDGACEYWASFRGAAVGTLGDNPVQGDVILTGRFIGWFSRVTAEDRIDGDVCFEGEFNGLATLGTTTAPLGVKAQIVFKGVRVQPIELPDEHGDKGALEAAIARVHNAASASRGNGGESIDEWLDDTLPIKEPESWSVAADTGRTSLRRKAYTESFDPFDPITGDYYDTEVFNNAGYDKLFVVPVDGMPCLRPIAGWAYPMFERCLPELLWRVFDVVYVNDPSAMNDPWNSELVPREAVPHILNVEALAKALATLHQRRDEEAAREAPAAILVDGAEEEDVQEHDGDQAQMDQRETAEDESEYAPENEYTPGHDDEEDAPRDPDPVELALNTACRDNIRIVKGLLQLVLDEANELSDHVPMILDVELL
jgi:hypothetical protein